MCGGGPWIVNLSVHPLTARRKCGSQVWDVPKQVVEPRGGQRQATEDEGGSARGAVAHARSRESTRAELLGISLTYKETHQLSRSASALSSQRDYNWENRNSSEECRRPASEGVSRGDCLFGAGSKFRETPKGQNLGRMIDVDAQSETRSLCIGAGGQ